MIFLIIITDYKNLIYGLDCLIANKSNFYKVILLNIYLFLIFCKKYFFAILILYLFYIFVIFFNKVLLIYMFFQKEIKVKNI